MESEEAERRRERERGKELNAVRQGERDLRSAAASVAEAIQKQQNLLTKLEENSSQFLRRLSRAETEARETPQTHEDCLTI